MKVSISLPDDDLAFVDGYVRTRGFQSRSAVLHQAIRLLRASELGAAYADAWEQWDEGGDAAAWEAVAGDGVVR